MKTTKFLTLAIAATCALGASGFAAQNSETAKKSAKMEQKKTWDSEQPTALRIVGYPFVYLERAGHSLIDSPEIVSQTFKGQRSFVSKDGLFAQK